MPGRLTRWFEDRIAELRAEVAVAATHGVGASDPVGSDAATLAELEALRDEARRLEEEVERLRRDLDRACKQLEEQGLAEVEA